MTGAARSLVSYFYFYFFAVLIIIISFVYTRPQQRLPPTPHSHNTMLQPHRYERGAKVMLGDKGWQRGEVDMKNCPRNINVSWAIVVHFSYVFPFFCCTIFLLLANNDKWPFLFQGPKWWLIVVWALCIFFFFSPKYLQMFFYSIFRF